MCIITIKKNLGQLQRQRFYEKKSYKRKNKSVILRTIINSHWKMRQLYPANKSTLVFPRRSTFATPCRWIWWEGKQNTPYTTLAGGRHNSSTSAVLFKWACFRDKGNEQVWAWPPKKYGKSILKISNAVEDERATVLEISPNWNSQLQLQLHNGITVDIKLKTNIPVELSTSSLTIITAIFTSASLIIHICIEVSVSNSCNCVLILIGASANHRFLKQQPLSTLHG